MGIVNDKNYFYFFIFFHICWRKKIWNQDDCKKIKEASALFLYYSGKFLEDNEIAKKKGEDEKAEILFKYAL